MSAVPFEHLSNLYADGDDPWQFRTSGYEAARFQETRAALAKKRYASALELGCGNGELARHIAPFCDSYTGVDAVETALAAARRAVPQATFLRGFLPEQLPPGSYDLIILSEILYFLDATGINALALQIDERWPRADLICVNYRGPTGNALQGEAALALFLSALSGRNARTAKLAPQYRIDTISRVAAAQADMPR